MTHWQSRLALFGRMLLGIILCFVMGVGEFLVQGRGVI